jgi:hypothetical protein
MLVRGVGIRDISEIQEVSIRKVLSVLVNSHHILNYFANKILISHFFLHLVDIQQVETSVYFYLKPCFFSLKFIS